MNHLTNMYFHEFRKMTYGGLAHMIMIESVSYSDGTAKAGFGTVDRVSTTSRIFSTGILGSLNDKDAKYLEGIGVVNQNVSVWMLSEPLHNKEGVVIYQQLNNPRKSGTCTVTGSVLTTTDLTAGLYKGLYLWQGTNLFPIIDNTATTITVTGTPSAGNFLISGVAKWFPIFGNISPQVGDSQPFYQVICTTTPVIDK